MWRVFTQPWPAGPKDNRRDQVIYYTYKAAKADVGDLHAQDDERQPGAGSRQSPPPLLPRVSGRRR